jgi:phage tail sheath protein FI
MGARTLSSSFSDIYVPVRRSLNYLNDALKNATLFSVFEPNDNDLWSTVKGVVEGLLFDFWRDGGLLGTTAEEAFYVKCDSTINTPSSISAGELRIEVGVALQRPAEFVVIKLGQTSGGTTITTSI